MVGCWFFVVGLSLFLSPPSDCFSLPSMMTWAPCPHGVRARGKKRTGCTYKSRGIVVGSVQTVAAIANDESLQVWVRKSHPPEGRSSRHPSAHKGAKTGCALTLRNAASLQKHCSVACKARVKQVRPWTCPSMVYVPLCASSIATLYHPPVGNEELRLSFPLAHCIVNGD